jgi:DSF synthase
MGALDFSLPVLERAAFEHIALAFDMTSTNTLWITMKRNPGRPVHNFSLPLLRELLDLMQTLRLGSAHWLHEGRVAPVHYAVMRSEHPDYYNLGGDLPHLRQCIGRRDGAALSGYARLCLQLMCEWASCSELEMTTIALVQGRALGGGFESALSSDYLIAEEHSSFGFPEILFGLVPCTGAMSLLSRRLPPHQAERIITSGKTYSAREMLDLGVVDEVCPSGDGEAAVEAYIASHAKRRAARLAMQRARSRICPLDNGELAQVVDEWVEMALALSPDELRVMDMLIRMQHGIHPAPR